MKESIGKVTITEGEYRIKKGNKLKALAQEKKQAKKQFEQACRNQDPNREQYLDIYIEKQKATRKSRKEN